MIGARTLTPFWPQWLAAYEVFLLSLMVGTNTGWTSPFIARLSGENPIFEATEEEIAWVASLVNLSKIIGVISGCFLNNIGGSKRTLYFCGLLFTFSWIVLTVANSISIVYISLVCNGISAGMLSTTFPLFIGEIANPKIRGKLITISFQGSTMGSLFGSILGTYLTPWVYAAINLIPSAMFVVSFYFIPNTPHYLLHYGKTEEAATSVRWYNRGADASKEIDTLTDFLGANPKISFIQSLRKLFAWQNVKSLLHLNFIYSVSQLTGVTTIQAYLEVLYKQAQINILAPSSLVILLAAMSIVSCWLTVVLIGKFGRITLFLSGSIAISVALAGWGLNYHLLELGFNEPMLQWLTIVSLIVWRISLYLGLASTVPAMLSEFFAPDVKNIAVCFTNITSSLFSFVSNKSFYLLINYITLKYVFYSFAVVTALLGVYCKVFIIETKGMSLAEIQDILNKSAKIKQKKSSNAPKSLE